MYVTSNAPYTRIPRIKLLMSPSLVMAISLINGGYMSRNKCWVCKKDLNFNMPKENRIVNYIEKCKKDKYLRQYCSNKCLKVDHK